MTTFSLWPFKRSEKKPAGTGASVLRVATSSTPLTAKVESLRVEGANGYAQGSKVRAALFVPRTVTTVQFSAEPAKRSALSAAGSGKASCVHCIQLLTAEETASILADVERVGTAIGWCAARTASTPLPHRSRRRTALAALPRTPVAPPSPILLPPSRPPGLPASRPSAGRTEASLSRRKTCSLPRSLAARRTSCTKRFESSCERQPHASHLATSSYEQPCYRTSTWI